MGIIILPIAVVMIALLIAGIVQWKRAAKFPVVTPLQRPAVAATFIYTLLVLIAPYALNANSKIWVFGAFFMVAKWSMICGAVAIGSLLLKWRNNSPAGMLFRSSLCTTAGATPLLILYANDWLAALFSIRFVY